MRHSIEKVKISFERSISLTETFTINHIYIQLNPFITDSVKTNSRL